SSQCIGELGMGRFGSDRRTKTERELAGSMYGVLERRQSLEYGFLVEELARIGGDRLELGERPGKALPQTGKRCYVPLALPTRDARSHGAILALQWPQADGGSRTHCARRGRRRQSAHALPHQPGARGLSRAGSADGREGPAA